MNVDTFLYREESTWIKVRFGGEMVWYRNVLFDPSEGEALLLVAGRAAKHQNVNKDEKR